MRDPRVEQWLSSEGVPWHHEQNIPLTKINHEASLKNQARIKAIDHDHVLELAISIEQGYDLPDLLGYYGTDRLIVLIAGNHRNEAYSLTNKTTADFYIIDVTHPWVIDRLTRTANRMEGLPLSQDERISHGIYMIRNYNYPCDTTAKMLGLPEKLLYQHLSALEVEERLAKLGFTDKIPMTTLVLLKGIKQDKALLDIAQLIIEARLIGDEVAEIVRRVKAAAASEKQQENEIARIRDDYRTRIAKIRKGTLKKVIIPTIELRQAVDTINRIRPETVKPLDPDLKRRVGWALDRLGAIYRDGS